MLSDEPLTVLLFPPSSAFLSAAERIIYADSMPEMERAKP